jgi:RNA-binding protein MEX3
MFFLFIVTGLPDNVQSARRQIEAHIAIRTGNSASPNELNNLSNEMSGSQDFMSSPLLSSLYKNGLNSLLEHLDMKDQEIQFGQAAQMISSTGSSTCSSSSSTSSKSMMIRPELIDLWKTMGNDSIDCDEGIGDSSPMNIWSSVPNSSSLIASRSSPSASASPTDSLLTSSNPSKNSFGLNDDFGLN